MRQGGTRRRIDWRQPALTKALTGGHVGRTTLTSALRTFEQNYSEFNGLDQRRPTLKNREFLEHGTAPRSMGPAISGWCYLGEGKTAQIC
jgi:hypothetical protein